MDRMTWIKPSFLWMMYRSGWGKKDAGQKRILAIDITREGFEWALGHSCLSHFNDGNYTTRDEWLTAKNDSPVRIQWDPERDLALQPLKYRAIQIGLSSEAVQLYVNEWLQEITEVTETAERIHSLVEEGSLESAKELLPIERPYAVSSELRAQLGM